MWTKKSVTETITALIVFLFLYTGISKYYEFASFRNVLSESPLLKIFATGIAVILPGMEIAVVILLAIHRTRYWGLIASTTLLSIFTLYIVYMLFFSSYLPCSCGGVIGKLSWRSHIIFNLCFIILAVIALRNQRKLAAQGTGQ